MVTTLNVIEYLKVLSVTVGGLSFFFLTLNEIKSLRASICNVIEICNNFNYMDFEMVPSQVRVGVSLMKKFMKWIRHGL